MTTYDDADFRRYLRQMRPINSLEELGAAAFDAGRIILSGEVSRADAAADLRAMAWHLVCRFGEDAVQAVIAASFREVEFEAKQTSAAPNDESSNDDLRNDEFDARSDMGRETRRAGQQLVIRRASKIVPEPITWIWPGRLAAGKLTVVGGDPGLGKSQLLMRVAATISTGGIWPCSEGQAPIGSVIILSAEDGDADTIVPRLMAAGANCNRVHIVTAVRELHGKRRRSFNLQTDIEILKRKIEELGDVSALLIDPVSSYLGKINSHNNAEIRSVLEPFGDMANLTRVAVLASTHLSKGGPSTSSRALYRFVGSIGYVAAARIATIVAEDPDDESRRLFLHVKNNLAPRQPGLAFRCEQRLVADGIVTSSIAWESAHVSHTADAALGPTPEENGTAKDDAIEFLRTVLAAGPVKVEDIEKEARAACLLGATQPISQNKPLRSAREKLAIKPSRQGFGSAGVWVWALPDGP
jgi:putative DNA primase/helicase